MSTTDRILGGNLSRRAFLCRLALVAGGSAVALALACSSEATAIAPTATAAAPMALLIPGACPPPTRIPIRAGLLMSKSSHVNQVIYQPRLICFDAKSPPVDAYQTSS